MLGGCRSCAGVCVRALCATPPNGSKNSQKPPNFGRARAIPGVWSCNRAALEILPPPPPGLNSQEPPTPPTVPVLAPLLPCTPSNPTGQPPTPPREQTPAKRPVSHRKREPFRPFLYASFNSRNSPFYCCKKFNFSRSLNVSPIVAQSPDAPPFLRCPKIPKIPRFWCSAITAKIPFLTVRENRENPTPPGGISPPPLAAFPPPVCRGRVLSYPAALSVGKTRHGGAANPPTRARWIFCIFARFSGGVVLQSGRLRDFGPPPPRRVYRFRRGCCPQHLREPGTNPPIFPVQEHGTRREK